MPLTIFDTDILIDVGRGNAGAISFLRSQSDLAQLAVSTITTMELIVGCRDKIELQNVSRFLARFAELPINEQISDAAVDLVSRFRLSHGMLIPDSLIAATALHHDADLITGNHKDFRFIPGLRLVAHP
jgi:predicted nucleic acid-binding protein